MPHKGSSMKNTPELLKDLIDILELTYGEEVGTIDVKDLNTDCYDMTADAFIKINNLSFMISGKLCWEDLIEEGESPLVEGKLPGSGLMTKYAEWYSVDGKILETDELYIIRTA